MAEEKIELKVGDSVIVKSGVKDPDLGFDITGWQGRVTEFDEEDGIVCIEWDTLTLRNIPYSIIEKCKAEGLKWWDQVFLELSEVEITTSRDSRREVVEMIAELESQTSKYDSNFGEMKKCPFCAEQIQNEAVVCRYCGRDLLDVRLKSSRRDLSQPLHWFWYLMIGVVTLLIFAAVLFSGVRLIYPDPNNASPDELQTAGIFIYVASFITYVSIWLLATKGRYGNFKIFNLLIILFWSLIPILNWGIVYYLGKGMYMWVSGQEYKHTT